MSNEAEGESASCGNDLPYVTIKYAQTLDGRIATITGQSQWISSGDSLAYAHQLRAGHDALMVGIGTVLQDNPRLTVRLVDGRNPLRVVVDSRLRTPRTANILSDGNQDNTLLVVTSSAPNRRIEMVRNLGAQVLVAKSDHEGRVDLAHTLRRLRLMGIRSIMVEGGARMITSLLHSHLVNRVVICIAPKLIGAGIEAVGDLGIDSLPQAITFSSYSFVRSGEDMLFDGQIGSTATSVTLAQSSVQSR